MNADTYGKFRQLVRVLGGYVRSGETSVWVRCPAHDDHDRSLSVCLDDWILVYCHAGCSEDAVFTAVRAALALDEALGDPVPGSAMNAAALSHRRAALDAALGELKPGGVVDADLYTDFQESVTILGGCVRSGETSASVRCPAHDDHDQSLSVHVTSDGILAYCHAGCSQDAVLAAVGAALRAALGDTPALPR